MTRFHQVRLASVSILLAVAAGLFFSGRRPVLPSWSSFVTTDHQPRLVSVQSLPNATDGQMCEWVTASSQERLVAALQEERAAATDQRTSDAINRPPLRMIRDPYAIYSAVAVDPLRNELVLQDENLFQIMVYDRNANTPPKAAMTEPKRVIGGPNTKVEFNCGIYVDPSTGDIYSVNNDTLNTMTVFSRSSKGNVPPTRELRTPHRTFGIAVDESASELFLTVQHPPAVVVYNKSAKDNDAPIRIMEGDHTRLEDPHGIAVDTKDNLMFVANQGSVSYFKEGKNLTKRKDANGEWHMPSENESRQNMIPGSGVYKAPTITVYPLKAEMDAAPMRIIEGPNTQLDWPAQIYVDQERGELYVANDVGDSILVFRTTDSGNVAPTRVIKGPKSGIKNPTGVFLDTKNQEVVVANMGNHSATVYPRTANGDVAPLRTIRASPAGRVALDIGNPGAVSYDSKRDQIYVPNCVAHPQIAVFSRMANGGDAPTRVIAGQATKLSRTMHDVRYDAIHDEVFVSNPFAQALLAFRGGADGEEAPIRVIQGPHTNLVAPDVFDIDPVHNEIFVPDSRGILVFRRDGQGDSAPIRTLRVGTDLGEGSVAVDPIHNVLVDAGSITVNGKRQAALLIYNRTDEGDTKPKAIISGPKTGLISTRQLQIYPEGGWIIVTQITSGEKPEPENAFVGVWSVNDNGDVPPRWRIDAKPSNTLKKPRGVVVDAKHKELIVSDMRLNAVLTYSFPELFK